MPYQRGIYVEKITTQGQVYLTRVHMTPWDWWPFKTRIYLHIFSRPDEDRVFHDHPWDFRTLVLWGGYDEESHALVRRPDRYMEGHQNGPVFEGFMTEAERAEPRYDRPVEPSGRVVPDRLGWLAWRFRPRWHAHRITRLHTPRVITLIFRGGRERDWGFWCPPNLPQYAGLTRSTVNNDTPYWKWVYWRDYLDQPDPAVGEQY